MMERGAEVVRLRISGFEGVRSTRMGFGFCAFIGHTDTQRD